MKKTLLSTKEVSNELGVHINTVRTMAEDGRLKGVKTKGESGHWRFPSEEVEMFKQSGKHRDIQSILKDIIYITDEVPVELLGDDGYFNASLWEYINRYYGIRSVFGSYPLHADMGKYREIIDKKGFVWLGEGAANFMDVISQKSKSETYKDRCINEDINFAFGVVKYSALFGEESYSLVPLLVAKDKGGTKWVVDGTLQQFYPNLEKGLAVLPLEKAKELYIALEIFRKKEFAILYSDPYISDKFIEKAKELEKEAEELSLNA